MLKYILKTPKKPPALLGAAFTPVGGYGNPSLLIYIYYINTL